MPATIYPQFEVVPFVSVQGANTTTGYLIQMILATVNGAIIPDATDPTLKYPSYAAMIAALALQASVNYPAWPYAYCVGTYPNMFSTDALAKAAAIADCTKIVNQRNTNIAAGGINADNPFVTLSAPVYGPA